MWSGLVSSHIARAGAELSAIDLTDEAVSMTKKDLKLQIKLEIFNKWMQNV